jgi:GAF domain-containing protein
MPGTEVAKAMAELDRAIANVKTAQPIWAALQELAQSVVGARLFTVMHVDFEKGVAGRVHTSDPVSYAVSGTKPINRTYWFDVVHVERRPFVANTIEEIAKVFPDHETIRSLGCGSVVNLPVVIADELVGTVNLLHEEQYYTPERVAAARTLSLPAKAAFLAALSLERK